MFATKQNQNLEKAIQDTYTQFQVSHPESRELLFDRHFVTQHLTPILGSRLQAGCSVDVDWVAQLWASHVGVSERMLEQHAPEVNPMIGDFIRSFRNELQSKGGNYRMLSNLVCAA